MSTISYGSNGQWPAERYKFRNNPYNWTSLTQALSTYFTDETMPNFWGYVSKAFPQPKFPQASNPEDFTIGFLEDEYGMDEPFQNEENFNNPDNVQGRKFAEHLVFRNILLNFQEICYLKRITSSGDPIWTFLKPVELNNFLGISFT